MFRRIPFLIIYRLGNFDYLIQGGFWVILKNAFADLCKPIHVDIIIPVSSDLLKSWNCRKEGENYWKIEYLKNEKKSLDEMKAIFHNFWNTFFR